MLVCAFVKIPFLRLLVFLHPYLRSSSALTPFTGSASTFDGFLGDTAFELRGKEVLTPEVSTAQPEAKRAGGAVSEFLQKVHHLARIKFTVVEKLRLHVHSEYERLSNGTTELAMLTENLKKALVTAETELSKSTKRKAVQDRKNEVDGGLDTLHSNVSEILSQQFTLSREVTDLGVLDAKTIRQFVVPAVFQDEQLQEKFVRFPQLLQEQFLTKSKYFDELRKHRNILQLKAASLYTEPKTPYTNPFRATDMETLVQSHLDLLARNKLSDINYASNACGATVVRTVDNTGVPGNDPALMLSDTVVPGHAWSFLELPASIMVKLCLPVRMNKISLEHIVGYFPEMHLTEAAPADFEIWGHSGLTDLTPSLLLKERFDNTGHSLQTFPVDNERQVEYRFVELKILNNHGNPCKTSVYHFQVYGVPTNETLQTHKIGI